jgi:hypothetical protein
MTWVQRERELLRLASSNCSDIAEGYMVMEYLSRQVNQMDHTQLLSITNQSDGDLGELQAFDTETSCDTPTAIQTHDLTTRLYFT